MLGQLLHTLRTRHNVRRHAWQSLANYVQLGGGMVIGIVLARLLMPEDFGRFAYISAVVTALMIPFWITVTPLLVTDGGRNSSLFGDVLGFMCITTALKTIVLCCYILYQIIDSQPEQALLAFLIGVPVAFFDIPETLRADLEGRGRFAPNFVVQVANIATSATVSIGLVLLGWGAYGLALGGFAAYWPQLLLYFVSGQRKMSEARFCADELVQLARSGVPFWAMQVSSNMLAKVDKIFLGRSGGDTQLGYYNRAFNYGPFCLFLLGSLLTNASVVAMKQQPSMEGQLRILRKTSLLLFTSGIINWAVLWWFSDPVVPWLFGEQWREAIPAFQAFSWLGLATALQYTPTNFLLANQAHFQAAIGKVIGLFALLAFLAVISAKGGASAVSVAYAYSASMAVSGLCMVFPSLLIVRKALRHE